ncbi:unnamed protein product [Clavelina lepadiformis]|uniref:Uncharacterized protein n=1 Tax=Clavelina lepadiformis TaxID=159417 RepID=A0ABP0H1C6_CLALP
MDVPRLYILIGLVAFAAVDHVASQTDEECRFSSSARRRRCPFGVRRGDRIGCIRQGCCYDESVSSRASVRIQCYQKERPLSFGFGTTTQPPALQNQNSGYLNFGGEPGYPGSILLTRCSGGPCFGFQSLPRGFCSRIGCCYDAQRRQCFSNIFTFIRLRPNCRPGFENAPSCREINECDSNPCVNGVNCINLINDFLCCVGEPEGKTCDQVCPFPTLTSTDGGLTPTSGGPYGVDETIVFSCTGLAFMLTGSDTLTCMKNGAFDNQAPVCDRILCPFPTLTSTNGGLTPTSGGPYGVDDTIVFSCTDVAFMLTGSDTLTCMNNGAFDNQAPVCDRIVCPFPTLTSTNGGLTPTSGGPYGVDDTIVFSCTDVAFMLTGSDTLTCMNNGAFDNQAPVCDRIVCPFPTLTSTIGGLTPTSGGPYGVDDTIVFSCTDVAFMLTGSDTLTCMNNGAFDNQAPVCDRILCPFPTLTSTNGGLTPTSGGPYGVDDTIVFSCTDVAFMLTGSDTLTCMNNGAFDNQAPVCDRIVCPFPTLTSTNGGLTPTSGGPYGVDDTIVFSCTDVAFMLTGSDTLTCMNNGAFDNPAPVCDRILCPFPTLTSTNGGLTPTSGGPYGVDDTIVFSCTDVAFMLTGSGTLTCMNNGAFDNQAPVCDRIVCPFPSLTSTDGGLTPTSGGPYGVDDTIVFSCTDVAFMLTGSDTLTCMNNGAFDNQAPVCDRILCPFPTLTSTIGGLTPTSGGPYGVDDTIVFSCTDVAFMLTGSDTLTCMNNGAFDNQAPVCDRILCPFPTLTSTNGGLTPTSGGPYGVDDTIVFSCTDVAFMLTGSDTLTCMNNGAFDNQAPVCDRIVCPFPTLTSTIGGLTPTSGGPYGVDDTIVFSCTDVAFMLTGSDTLTCMNNGAFDNQAPVCDRILCPFPTLTSTIGGLTPTSGGPYGVDDTIVFSCTDVAFMLTGSDTLTCMNNGAFDNQAPVCDRIVCPFPTLTSTIGGLTPTSGGPYGVDDTIVFSCTDVAFMLTGSDTLTCMNNGAFDNQAPVCDRIVCPFPTLTSTIGGLTPTSGGPYGVDDTIVFSCTDVAFMLTGSDTLTCMNNGAFDNQAPVCDRIVCPFPTLTSTNGGLTPTSGGPYGVDDTIVFSCTDLDFLLTGSDTLTCMNNGAFDNQAPVCDRNCGDPPASGNTRVITSWNGQTTQGTVILYSCTVGLLPPATTTCEASGNWNPGTLSDCVGEPVPGRCGSPYPLVNGEYSPSAPVSVGTTITYQCLDGFSLAPGSIVTTTCESGNDYSLDPNSDPNFPQCI